MKKIISMRALGLIVTAFTVFITLSTLIPAGECYQDSEPTMSSIITKYTIKPGDTLYDIARNNQVTVHDLTVLNNLTGEFIKAGDVLKVPQTRLSRDNISLSREELLLLAKVIHAEARGESFEGKVAVGAVVLNRLASPFFPQTIKEIIYQKNDKIHQFSPVEDGSINLTPDEKAFEAATQALFGSDPTNGALFFYNPNLSKDQWIRTLPVMTKIGNHVFATGS
jgi:N-acetylmuramoyl-L-alanine amidase